jgi:MYXO-CTERM domain-containing protein
VAAFVSSVPEPGLEVWAAVGVMALARRRRSVR